MTIAGILPYRRFTSDDQGYGIRTIQELPGHRNVSMTMIYTHVLSRGGLAVRSPLNPRRAATMIASSSPGMPHNALSDGEHGPESRMATPSCPSKAVWLRRVERRRQRRGRQRDPVEF